MAYEHMYKAPSTLKRDRKQREKARAAMEAAQALFAEWDRKVREDEATEILGMVDEIRLTPEQFAVLLKGLRANGGVPFPLEQPQPASEPNLTEENEPPLEQEQRQMEDDQPFMEQEQLPEEYHHEQEVRFFEQEE